MISLHALLRSRVAALSAPIMVSPWADSYLLLGYSLGAFVLRLLFIAASCVAQCKVLKLLSCNPSRHLRQIPRTNTAQSEALRERSCFEGRTEAVHSPPPLQG